MLIGSQRAKTVPGSACANPEGGLKISVGKLAEGFLQKPLFGAKTGKTVVGPAWGKLLRALPVNPHFS